jgi:hypothetical protein
VPFMCNVAHYFSSYSFIGHYTSRPDWPSSGVQAVVVKDSAAHSNAVFFPPIVVVSGYFGYVGYHQFFLFPCVSRGCSCFCLVCWLWLP